MKGLTDLLHCIITFQSLSFVTINAKVDKTSSTHPFVGNKAKGQISKRVFQECKARQNFRKTNISYTLICTRTCAYQEVGNVCFSETLACFAFLKHPF